MEIDELIERVKDPHNIKDALYASSPYVLAKALAADPTVKAMVDAGLQVTPGIAAVIRQHGLTLHEVTLACYAYVLEHADPGSLANVLGPTFAKAVESPGPFFVHFVAHALQHATGARMAHQDMIYTSAELEHLVQAVKVTP